jgi:ABC-type Na+ transport system ATPase subunit NatA
MKPQELADELTKMFRGEEYDRLIHEIPDLLRQQQAEIKELKAKLQLHEAMDNQCASLMQQFRKAQENG